MSRPDLQRFRNRRKDTPARPYENISGFDPKQSVLNAQVILAEGWTRAMYPAVDVSGSIPWEESLEVSRSYSFHLHCWDMLDDLLKAYSLTGERRYLDPALKAASDWLSHYTNGDTDSGFAWYDMAVGLRAYRLAYLLDVAAGMEDVADADLALMLTGVEVHRQVLGDERSITYHSNHGFYQIAGQLAMARRLYDLPGMVEAAEQSEERFKRMLATQFTEEGVHREHSPDYHRMVYDTLRALIDSGLIQDLKAESFARRIEEALAWFVLPNGYLVNFGDSNYRSMLRGERYARKYYAPAMQFVASGGRIGRPPDSRVAAFEESGYFVARDAWPQGPEEFDQGSYLAQTLCFHSRIHKHADDLSFVWYDRGSEILVDAGRYGYLEKTEPGSELWEQGHWYADPNRVYVEHTRAHNTVEIDGRISPRKGVKPYGSALQRWGETEDGIIYCESHMYLFKTIRHARVLLFQPRQWLLVFDWLWDNLKQPHDFRQWFHFAVGLAPALHDGQVVVELKSSREPLRVASLLPGIDPSRVCMGETYPELQGWWSPQDKTMIPNAAVAFEKKGSHSAVFATLFAFARNLTPDRRQSQASASGRKARLMWRTEEKTQELHISRPRLGDIEVRWREKKA